MQQVPKDQRCAHTPRQPKHTHLLRIGASFPLLQPPAPPELSPRSRHILLLPGDKECVSSIKLNIHLDHMFGPRDGWWDFGPCSLLFFQHKVGVRPSVRGWLDGKREASGQFLLWVGFTASSTPPIKWMIVIKTTSLPGVYLFPGSLLSLAPIITYAILSIDDGC